MLSCAAPRLGGTHVQRLLRRACLELLRPSGRQRPRELLLLLLHGTGSRNFAEMPSHGLQAKCCMEQYLELAGPSGGRPSSCMGLNAGHRPSAELCCPLRAGRTSSICSSRVSSSEELCKFLFILPAGPLAAVKGMHKGLHLLCQELLAGICGHRDIVMPSVSSHNSMAQESNGEGTGRAGTWEEMPCHNSSPAGHLLSVQAGDAHVWHMGCPGQALMLACAIEQAREQRCQRVVCRLPCVWRAG